jgi:hypothetical protein
MPSLVIHAPEYQVFENDKKSFKDTFETGVGRGYALNNTILRQISPGCRVVLLCKDEGCRAEGELVKLEPAMKDGRLWKTSNHIQRYHVHVRNFKRVPFRTEKLNRNGINIIYD